MLPQARAAASATSAFEMLAGGLAHLNCLPISRVSAEGFLGLVERVSIGPQLEKGAGQERRGVCLAMECCGSCQRYDRLARLVKPEQTLAEQLEGLEVRPLSSALTKEPDGILEVASLHCLAPLVIKIVGIHEPLTAPAVA